jgi:hypothetical protein
MFKFVIIVIRNENISVFGIYYNIRDRSVVKGKQLYVHNKEQHTQYRSLGDPVLYCLSTQKIFCE